MVNNHCSSKSPHLLTSETSNLIQIIIHNSQVTIHTIYTNLELAIWYRAFIIVNEAHTVRPSIAIEASITLNGFIFTQLNESFKNFSYWFTLQRIYLLLYKNKKKKNLIK